MDTLYDMINTVIQRPELYIGKPSLERLYAFIGGYLTGNPGADDHCLDGFNAYISERYHIYTSHNWSSIIQFFSNSDRDAFDLFIKHFQDYTHKTYGKYANGTDDALL